MEERRRGRILLGALDVFGRQGFAASTVQALIDQVGISRATFYKYFPDREACFAALGNELFGWLEDEAEAAAADSDDWPSETVEVARRLVDLFTGDPRIARVCGAETTFVTAAIDARRDAAFAALAGFLRRGRAESGHGGDLPAITEEVLVLGAVDFVTRSALADRGASSAGLGAEVAELILLHYVGSARARKLVRGI